VRQFNRFYTRQIGVLQETLLASDFSLTETRVLYELAHSTEATATQLIAKLGLDAGYLSRILRRLEKLALVPGAPRVTMAGRACSCSPQRAARLSCRWRTPPAPMCASFSSAFPRRIRLASCKPCAALRACSTHPLLRRNRR
jgi:hypothetical protein